MTWRGLGTIRPLTGPVSRPFLSISLSRIVRIALDAICGLTDAIHHSLLEGPCDVIEIGDADKAALNGLAELLREKVHTAHDYFSELENRGLLDLPMSQAEIDAQDLKYTGPGVKKEPALYIVRR